METYKKKKTILLFTLILIIFFEPQIFKENSFVGVQYIDYIYKVLKILAFLVTTYKYVLINKGKVTKTLISVSLLQLVMFISTIIYKGDIVRFAGPALTTITMTMIAEILIKEEILFKILKKVNIYFVVCFIINMISVILIDFTDVSKYVSVYFMGIDNRFIFTLLPWILFEGLVSLHQDNQLNKRWKVVVILSELLLIYKFSVSAMICIGLYLFLFVKFVRDMQMSKCNNFVFVTYVLSNILVLLDKLRKIFLPLLKILGKDATTLSGRTYLWEGVMEQTYKHPIIGYGMQSIEYDKSFFYNSTAPYYLKFCKVSHAHNSLMTLLYRGGIIAVTIYLSIVYKALKQLKNNLKNKYANILLITAINIFLTSIFDTMDFAALYFVFTLCISIEEIKDEGIEE